MTIFKMQIILTVVNILPMLGLVAGGKYLYNDNYSQSHYGSQGSQWYQGQFDPQEVPIKNTVPNLEVVFDWKYLDFEYPNFNTRRIAIAERKFIPQNNLPLGVDFHKNRVFITTPRWKDGVPASLGYVDYPPSELSPAIKPYPNWDAHGDPYQPDCNKLISVYRLSIDDCNRMWLIDSGIVNATVSLNQICPPKIVAIDLNTDQIIISYELPASQIKEDSLHSNIIADVQAGRCEDAYVYVTDVWRFGIVVYSLAKNRSWRITNYNFSPNPTASNFNVYGLNFQWLDGVFGMSLSNVYDSKQSRLLYFHPMASFKEFVVSTELLRDENLWSNPPLDISQLFVEIGDRGANGQSSTSGIARNGVMFFTQVHRDNIGCWDTRKKYARSNLYYLLPDIKNNATNLIQFPNDLKVDKEYNQSVWVVSNRLPIYLYSQLNFDEVNFRILRGDVDKIVSGTVCDPQQRDQSIEDSVLVSLKEGQCF